MSRRLTGLDGLRGFAALAVVISHIGFNIRAISDAPLLVYSFRAISAGTYSVQLFFVLSGFLIAYFYPTLKSKTAFLQKRYLRIMPLFAVVVLYLWWVSIWPVHGFTANLLVLIVVAEIIRLGWKTAGWLNGRWRWIGPSIFVAFVGLQIGWLVLSVTILPSLMGEASPQLPTFYRQTFVMLSNLTMTMYLQQKLVVMSGLFWSLVPEVLFYIAYPFVIMPLLAIGKKRGWLVALLLSLSALKAIFDLDTATAALYSVHGIFLSRASGFLVGIWLGSIFLAPPRWWPAVEGLLKNRLVNILLLGLFAAALAFEWPDHFHQIRDIVKLHYLGLSVIFGTVIAAAIIPGSFLNRIFSHRWLVFLGSISFSLYLIHPEAIAWIEQSPLPMLLEKTAVSLPVAASLLAVSQILASIGVATILFKLVESLYFNKKLPRLVSKNITVKTEHPVPIWQKRAQGCLVVCGSMAVLLFVYAGDYSPSIVVERSALPSQGFLVATRITKDKPLVAYFRASHSDLSAVALTMDYARDPAEKRTAVTEQVQLIFKLYDASNQLLFTSTRQPQAVEGKPNFPFGFPTISESAGETYRVELSLQDAAESDQLYIYKDRGLVAEYSTIKQRSVAYLAKLGWWRLLFVSSQAQFWFGLVLVGLIAGTELSPLMKPRKPATM